MYKVYTISNIYFTKVKIEYHAVVTPGGNHCCLMANDVHNLRLFH